MKLLTSSSLSVLAGTFQFTQNTLSLKGCMLGKGLRSSNGRLAQESVCCMKPCVGCVGGIRKVNGLAAN